MSPLDSEDLTELIDARDGVFVVLQSPDTAEHAPDYRKVAEFATRAEAETFLTEGISDSN